MYQIPLNAMYSPNLISMEPDHEDIEKVLEFLKDKKSTSIDVESEVLRLLGWFFSIREYMLAFINPGNLSFYFSHILFAN